MRNLLGRLHARSVEQRTAIARLWRVPLFGRDTHQFIARIYQVMNDVRAIRDVWCQLGETEQQIVRLLARERAKPRTIAELATEVGVDEDVAHEAAASLFRWGILGREGDYQELPVGEKPRVFIPGELMMQFRRLVEEQAAGDTSGYPIGRLLDTRDDFEIEITATKWGARVSPGVKNRQHLKEEILDAMPARLDAVIGHLKPPAMAIWTTMLAADSSEPQPFADVMEQAGLTIAESPVLLATEQAARQRGALEAVENSLLVNHCWLEDGTRALFVPDELRNPQQVPVKVPLSPIQPLAEGTVAEPDKVHPFALAWDVMTVVREIANVGAPVWVPGNDLPQQWLRAINNRLWFRDLSEPPPGYAATLLYLALGVGALEPAPRTPGMEKAAIKPMLGRNARWWRSLSFEEQTERLRQNWLGADVWIEGREMGEIEIRGPDWLRFRHRLLTAVARMDPEEWVMVRDASQRLAEQDITMLGNYFEVVYARPDVRSRRAALATAIEVELLTAFRWFGLVETQLLGEKGFAMRITPVAEQVAREVSAMPASTEPSTGPAITVNHQGTVKLRRPAPIHIWSLTAFAENEQLSPVAVYQIRPASLHAALGAGFNLEHVIEYLEHASGQSLPDPLITTLRQWTAGYKRVKMHRVVRLELDIRLGLEELRQTLVDAGLEVIPGASGSILVDLPDTGEDANTAERNLLSVLRKAGYVGIWMKQQEI